MARIIVVGCEKGGVGKSTLSTGLAGFAAAHGPTALVDADPQGSSSVWGEARERTSRRRAKAGEAALPPVETAVARRDPAGVARDLARRHAVVVVDVPAGDRQALDDLLGLADSLIAPFGPSAVDLLTVPLLDRRAGSAGLGGRAHLVLNRVSALGLGGLERRARRALADLGLSCLAVAPTSVVERVAYPRAFMTGMTVVEAGTDRRAAAELAAVAHLAGIAAP